MMALSMALQPFLSSNIALDDLLRDVARSGGKIASRPEGGQTTQHGVLLTEMMRREALALLDHIGGRVRRPDTHKEMDMIGLYRQLQHLPTLLSTLLLDEGLAVCGDTAPKHGFPALGTPDQVVDDKMDAVFISLVIHVDIVAYNNTYIYTISLQSRLKPRKAPNVWGSISDACGGLRSVSVKAGKSPAPWGAPF